MRQFEVQQLDLCIRETAYLGAAVAVSAAVTLTMAAGGKLRRRMGLPPIAPAVNDCYRNQRSSRPCHRTRQRHPR